LFPQKADEKWKKAVSQKRKSKRRHLSRTKNGEPLGGQKVRVGCWMFERTVGKYGWGEKNKGINHLDKNEMKGKGKKIRQSCQIRSEIFETSKVCNK